MAVLDEYVGQNPDEAIEVGSTRALLLAQSGDVDAALKGLDALIEQFPEHPDLEYQRATVLETGGRTRAAVAQFERALKLRPDDPQLQNALGFTLADHKQNLARAEALVRTALAVSPDSAAIQDSLGWVLYRRGKTAAALPILERAWQNSGDGEIAAHFGEVLWKSGDEGAGALYLAAGTQRRSFPQEPPGNHEAADGRGCREPSNRSCWQLAPGCWSWHWRVA